MAVAAIIAAVALLVLGGLLVELRAPLVSLLQALVWRVCRYGVDRLVELFPESRQLRKLSGEVASEDTKSVVREDRVDLEPTSTSAPAPSVYRPPGDTHAPQDRDQESFCYTPSTDDQSDTATVHGEDYAIADPDSKAGGCPNPIEESPRKDEEVWFEDGNLILATATVQFRVYRGLLVRHSLVFKDMLSLPQPPDSDALRKCTQCVPVITIPVADSPQDLRHFLKALTGNCLFEDGMHPTYHEISSLIRMSHKYQCETILERCMKYMSSFYHDDFELWRNDEEVFSPPGFERIHSIGVVNLARLVGADKWLPGALMGCCMLGAELIDGFQREDGTRETLSLDDLGRCYLGRANLVEANATATLKLLKQTLSPDCRRPERCEPTLRQLLGDLADVEEHKKTVFNLRWDWSWTPYVDRQDVERELCWECYRMLGKHGRQKEIHAEIYERLPEMMCVKVERWGMPDPAPQPEEAPQDDADGAAPTPAPPAGGIPVPPLVIPPPQPIIIQPPQNAPPPPLPPPIVIPPAMHVVIPPPLMAQGHWQAPPPPPAQPAVPVVIIPPAAPGP